MIIETRLLNSFVCLAEELHFGRAAQKLHIAQPALTRQIQKLEALLEVRLLRRTQRSVGLTPAGRNFLERAYRILAEIEQAAKEVKQVEAGQQGKIFLGFIHSSTYGVTPLLLREFLRRFPQVDLELFEMTIQEQVAALREGKIDVGILRPPISDPSLRTCPLRQERFIVALPENHPLASLDTISLRELSGEGFILFAQRSSPLFYSRIIAMCEKAGFVPDVVQSAIQIHTAIGLVSANMGVAIVPEVARNLHMPGVRFVEIADRPPVIEVALAWRANNSSPAVTAFCELAPQTLAAAEPGICGATPALPDGPAAGPGFG